MTTLSFAAPGGRGDERGGGERRDGEHGGERTATGTAHGASWGGRRRSRAPPRSSIIMNYDWRRLASCARPVNVGPEPCRAVVFERDAPAGAAPPLGTMAPPPSRGGLRGH